MPQVPGLIEDASPAPVKISAIEEQNTINLCLTFSIAWTILPTRASFYSRLPVGHVKSAVLLVQISCEKEIQFLTNFVT